MTALVQTLTGIGATAAVVDRSAPSRHTVQVVITGTTLPTKVVVELEGSINEGANFAVLASHEFSAIELTSGIAIFHSANQGVDTLRVRIKTLTGGTDLVVGIWVRDTR